MSVLYVSSLGSGSKGNSLIARIEGASGDTAVMFDCGFGIRETERRLERIGVSPSAISAVFVTHEHKDHVSGAFRFARRHKIPLWMSHGTYLEMAKDAEGCDVRYIKDGESVAAGALTVSAFTISHDAREPLQYTVTGGGATFGMLTDTGRITPHISKALESCHVLMLECNYDEELLAGGPYPYYLQDRIRSGYGHLSNDYAGKYLASGKHEELHTVVGAHISQNNNLPELARAALEKAAEGSGIKVMIAGQDDGFGWIPVLPF